jgi:transketolase
MPSWELFESQGREYRDRVMPPGITARVAVEEASTFGWERYTGLDGTILGLHTFGLSAPMKVVAQHFGFDPAHVVAAAKEQIARHCAKQ